MNKSRKQSDSTYPLLFLMVDSTDHITGKTGLSPTVTISKNGGSFASPSGAVSEIGNGWYQIAGNATDSNTVGELIIHATGTAADPTDTSYTVVPYNPFDGVRLGLTSLPNAAAQASGGLYTRGTGAGQINQQANGQIDANTVKVSGTTQTARDIGSSVLISSGTGTGQLSVSSGVISSNMTQIDGSATNGNNAILKLKSLDIRSNDAVVSSIDVRGATGGAGLPGGKAINVIGGDGGTGITAGADGIYVAGGVGSGSGGYGLNLAAPNSGQGGLLVSGNYSTAAASFIGDSYTDGIYVTGGYNWAGGIRANINGDIYGSLNLRFKKNTGVNNFMFPMFDSTTKQPKSGLTVSAARAIDGSSYSPCSNSVVELSDGTYRINLSADDLNGDKIMFRFYATDADDQMVEIITQN